MSDFLIGLDLDGVCYNWDKTVRYMLRQRIMAKGANPPASLSVAAISWDSTKEAVTPEDWRWVWAEAIDLGLYRYGHVITGAIEGVQALNNLGDVVVITHRPKSAVHDTLAWLGFMFNRVPLSGVIIHSNGQAKSQVESQPDVYIDDAVHVADDVLDNTQSSVILFDQPWNQNARPSSRLYRAIGWPQVVKIAEFIKEANDA